MMKLKLKAKQGATEVQFYLKFSTIKIKEEPQNCNKTLNNHWKKNPPKFQTRVTERMGLIMHWSVFNPTPVISAQIS